MNVLFETDHLKIVLEDEGFFLITWKGFTNSEDFRSGVDKILALMEEYKVIKTITDLTEHRVISAEDQDYAAKASIDFDRHHWKVKRAIITPKDVFTRFGIKQVNAQVAKEEAQERKFFTTIEEAKQWLLEQNEEPNTDTENT